MTSPLQSYFVALAASLEIDLESSKVQEDNARTMKGSFDESLLGSRSSFSPDDSLSRWMQNSSSSDVSLSIPGRRSSLERIPRNEPCSSLELGRKEHETIELEPIMSPIERWLQELPVENHDEIPTSPIRVQSFDDEKRNSSFEENDNTEDEIPLLKGYRYGTDERYPISSLLEYYTGGLIRCPKLWEDETPKSLECANESREDQSVLPNEQMVEFLRQKRVSCTSRKTSLEKKTATTIPL